MKLTDVKGIGPSTLQKLGNLGIKRIRDLVYHFPFRYVDRRKRITIQELKEIEDETDNYHCVGIVKKISQFTIRGRKQVIVNASIEDDHGTKITLNWFNNPYVTSNLHSGDKVLFSGKISKSKIFNPKYRRYTSDEDLQNFVKIEPVYPETKGLKSNQISNFIKDALQKLYLHDQSVMQIEKQTLRKHDLDDSTMRYEQNSEKNNKEFHINTSINANNNKQSRFLLKQILSDEILSGEGLIERFDAFTKIHFPSSEEDLVKSRNYFAFEELYQILNKLKKRKEKLQKYTSHQMHIKNEVHQDFLATLDFDLTSSQQNVIQEIFVDLQNYTPMHRLLNGDVGSGKTVVAFAAMLQAALNGYQVALLAPTSVLAEQHYKTFAKLQQVFGLDVALVTAKTSKALKQLPKLPQIFVGTHALFYREDMFFNLGLVVIDEQHKFGVEQRGLLKRIALENSFGHKVPHILSMSATPIPRTLALTLFSDMDISFLDKPISRKQILTKFIPDDVELETKMYEWMEEEIKKNKAQSYIVCPLIEDNETKEDVKSVDREYKKMQEKFPFFSIGKLYGSLLEKEEIVEKFKHNEYEILVTTSVVEVGIDNPNATLMIIEGAERFGLAQLHQIRGRVGRSDRQSYCFLRTTNGQLNDRVDFFCKNYDGFKIAEFDLQFRGPGEVYGSTQSGLPNLKVANILDIELIKRVRKYV